MYHASHWNIWVEVSVFCIYSITSFSHLYLCVFDDSHTLAHLKSPSCRLRLHSHHGKKRTSVNLFTPPTLFPLPFVFHGASNITFTGTFVLLFPLPLMESKPVTGSRLLPHWVMVLWTFCGWNNCLWAETIKDTIVDRDQKNKQTFKLDSLTMVSEYLACPLTFLYGFLDYLELP